ncbi:MAG: hypothetical protein GWN61_08860 [candidate division Zixibacteria bacterium]|nr:hypothetical protein [candidate division Zixibacteria bacterium]NIS46105.1 hypothetical protein [candidate division Zixibacteria bacterium]NIU14216.1 hypothetical protein [candidate division Zixibacteria bacterium]NIV06279.1 hypothetical protein [candidate division Zixibacteria bacterium]NIW45062.1 hypothetical protein [Gammaproteobacteria bacterium]
MRDRIDLPVNVNEEDAKSFALESEQVQKFLGDKSPKKVIYVPGRLVNIVV